jgi:hypothetical protein
VDTLLGYFAGVPTYLLAAELASCRPLRGEIPTAPFPRQLAASAPARRRSDVQSRLRAHVREAWELHRDHLTGCQSSHGGTRGARANAAKGCNETRLIEATPRADAEALR